MSSTVYLGLGSNLGDRAALIAAAVDHLVTSGFIRDAVTSPLYETDAVAVDPQPPYLNAVVRGTTTQSPQALLTACLQVEATLGRVRPPGLTKAPRLVDIDLLIYDNAIINEPNLVVPHPSLLDRPFVLIPLSDVALPNLTHPVTHQSLAAAAPSHAVRPHPP